MKVNKPVVFEIIMLFVLSAVLSFALKDKLMEMENSYPANENNTVFRLHMQEESTPGSWGRMLTVVNLELNGRQIDLKSLATEEWLWYDEYQVLSFEGDKQDLIVDIGEPIYSISMTYDKMSAGGILEIYSGEDLLDTIDTYLKDEWQCLVFSRHFVTKSTQVLQRVSDALLFFVVLLVLVEAIRRFFVKEEKASRPIGMGMFNSLRGMAMLGILMIHSMSMFIVFGQSLEVKTIAEALIIPLFNGMIPLFYIVSGYGFRAEAPAKCIKTQFKYLIKPYYIMVCLFAVFGILRAILFSGYSFASFKKQILGMLLMNSTEGTFLGIELGTMGPAWFCVALCFGWIILNFICKIPKRAVQIILVCLCEIIGYVFSLFDWKLLCLGHSFTSVLFIYIGYLLKQYKLLNKRNRKFGLALPVISIVCFGIACFNGLNHYVSLYLGENYWIGLVTSLVFGLFLIWIYRFCYFDRKINLLLLEKIGYYSYYVLLFHCFEYLLLPWQKIAGLLAFGTIVNIIIVFTVRVAASYVFLKLFHAMKHRRR